MDLSEGQATDRQPPSENPPCLSFWAAEGQAADRRWAARWKACRRQRRAGRQKSVPAPRSALQSAKNALVGTLR